MALILNIQSTVAFIDETGGTESVGPINVTGTMVPLRTFVNLVSGNNTIVVPQSSTITPAGVVITPPPTNTIVLIYKTTSGDVGVNIPKAAPAVFIFDTAVLPANIYVNAASTTTGYTKFLFF